MKKFRVYSIATASTFLGEFEAPTKELAIEKALKENPPSAQLCHECSDEMEIGEWYEEQADEIS